MTKLVNKKCAPCGENTKPLPADRCHAMLHELNGWALNEMATEIRKEFHLQNFFKTMAFVNVVGWIANHENHHPIMEVGYNYCTVTYSTHSASGLTENDFICAAKIDATIQIEEEA